MFVGRTNELNIWKNVLVDPGPACVMVIGAQGMGKSELLREMLDAATSHPTIQAGGVFYEVAPSDSFELLVHQMLDDAYEAARLPESSIAHTSRRKKQWSALIGVLPKGDQLRQLVQSLRFSPSLNPRQQLLEQLGRISQALPECGRAVFFIDPEKHLDPHHTDAWRLVVRDLPNKCKLVFSQRPDGALATDDNFMAVRSVVRIPPALLGVLNEHEVHSLVVRKLGERGIPLDPVLQAMERYGRHPYAISAALDLIRTPNDVHNLPTDPTPERISACQWRRVRQHGSDAIRLFVALAVLDVAVPVEIICDVAEISHEAFEALTAIAELRAFLCMNDDRCWKIYHSILTDHVLTQASLSIEGYHERATATYRCRLDSDRTAAVRMPIHARAYDGDRGFVAAVVESLPYLRTEWSGNSTSLFNRTMRHLQSTSA